MRNYVHERKKFLNSQLYNKLLLGIWDMDWVCGEEVQIMGIRNHGTQTVTIKSFNLIGPQMYCRVVTPPKIHSLFPGIQVLIYSYQWIHTVFQAKPKWILFFLISKFFKMNIFFKENFSCYYFISLTFYFVFQVSVKLYLSFRF